MTWVTIKIFCLFFAEYAPFIAVPAISYNFIAAYFFHLLFCTAGTSISVEPHSLQENVVSPLDFVPWL
jgi:hypothetical protein